MKTKNYFKMIAMMIMALVCVGFASCSKDEEGSNSKNDDLYGIWYDNETIRVIQGEQIVAAIRINSSYIRYNEDRFSLLKSNPDEFFAIGGEVQDLSYIVEGNALYGIRNGEKYEKTRTEFKLSEDKKTLYLKGYFSGTYQKLE